MRGTGIWIHDGHAQIVYVRVLTLPTGVYFEWMVGEWRSLYAVPILCNRVWEANDLKALLQAWWLAANPVGGAVVYVCAAVVSKMFCLLFYIIWPCKVIPTCDSAHPWWLYSAVSLGDHTTVTITLYIYCTQSHYPDIVLTSPCPILLMSSAERQVDFISHWFDSTGIRTPDLPPSTDWATFSYTVSKMTDRSAQFFLNNESPILWITWTISSQL